MEPPRNSERFSLALGLSLGSSAESAGRGSAVAMAHEKERAASPLGAGPDQSPLSFIVARPRRSQCVKGTRIPITLVGAPDAGWLREDRPGLSLKVAREEQRWRYRRPVVQLRRPMPGDCKLSDQRRRQSDRREAGLRGSLVLVDEPTQYVVASNVAERRGSRGHFAERCGHLESKAAVRPMLVVMPDVVAKDCFEVVATENERPVGHSSRTVRTQRSAIAFARGDLTGVLITSISSEANTSSKLAVNFASRSRIKNRNDRACSARSPARLRATWVTNEPVG